MGSKTGKFSLFESKAAKKRYNNLIITLRWRFVVLDLLPCVLDPGDSQFYVKFRGQSSCQLQINCSPVDRIERLQYRRQIRPFNDSL